MYTNGWLESLQEGGKVVIRYGRSISSSMEVAKVERITKTQITANNTKFRRCDGDEVASGYHGAYLVEATPEMLQEIEEANRRRILLNKVLDAKWKDLPTSVLEIVYAAITQEPEGKQ